MDVDLEKEQTRRLLAGHAKWSKARIAEEINVRKGRKPVEKHACVSDGLGLESIGHEDGGPWMLIERKTEKFLAIVRFCPWCGAKLTAFDEMQTGGAKTSTIVSKRRRGNFSKKNGKALLKLAEQIRKDGTFSKPVRRLGQ